MRNPRLLLAASALLLATEGLRHSTTQHVAPLPAPEPEPDLPNHCGIGTIEPLPRVTECAPLATPSLKSFNDPSPYRYKEMGWGTAIANREARKRAGLVGRRS